MKDKKLYIASAVGLLILFMAGGFFYKSHKSERLSFMASENSEVFIRDYSPRYGDSSAKVFLIEYLDPECESCRRVYPAVKDILKEYEGKVQLIVRYAPFHRNSKIAIRALEAARVQGKYWEAIEMLFHYQPEWGNHHNPRPELIFDYLPKLGLDMNKLNQDMQDPKIEKMINQDVEDLRKLEVRATPTFFVNGRPLQKFGIQYLRELIQEEVDKHY